MPITVSRKAIHTAAALAMGLASAGCVTTQQDSVTGSAEASDDVDVSVLERMLSGRSMVEGDELEAKVEAASAYPLGSKENPVRAQGPAGQRAYLSRLRCANLKRPTFSRVGSAGVSPYGNIVDIYDVVCEGSEPAQSGIYIDMYHRGHVEREAVPGFGITGGRESE